MNPGPITTPDAYFNPNGRPWTPSPKTNDHTKGPDVGYQPPTKQPESSKEPDTIIEDGVVIGFVNQKPFCFDVPVAGKDQMGFCTDDEPKCQTLITSLQTALKQKFVAKCEPAAWMACFNSKHVMSGLVETTCLRNLVQCQSLVERYLTTPDRTDIHDCVVVRYRP